MTRRLLTSGQVRQREKLFMKEMGRSILDTMASAIGDSVTTNVTAATTCGSKGKIRVAVVANSASSKSDILQSINSQFGGKLRGVARSFKIVETANSDRNNVQLVLEGYVVPNVEIVSASSEEGSQMKCVASNMFMDASDCIWSKSGDMLYKKSDIETSEELNTFLTECASSNVRQRKTQEFENLVVASGDFISYVHAGEMCYGFVIACDDHNQKLMVLADGEEDPEVIDTFDVQGQAPINDANVRFPEEEEYVETSATSVDVSAIISYYKRWIVYNPAYCNALIERLKGHSFC